MLRTAMAVVAMVSMLGTAVVASADEGVGATDQDGIGREVPRKGPGANQGGRNVSTAIGMGKKKAAKNAGRIKKLEAAKKAGGRNATTKMRGAKTAGAKRVQARRNAKLKKNRARAGKVMKDAKAVNARHGKMRAKAKAKSAE